MPRFLRAAWTHDPPAADLVGGAVLAALLVRMRVRGAERGRLRAGRGGCGAPTQVVTPNVPSPTR